MGSKIWPFVVAGCVVAVGCGGPSNDDLFQQPGTGTAGMGSTGGSSGSGASSSGGSSASAGSGGSSTGGSSTGGSSTGGSSGTGTGGTGTGGMGTGGMSAGGMGTGGMNTGGSTGGMSTGGLPASGGTGGMSTGGSPASGGTGGGPAGSGGDGGALAGRGGLGGSGGEANCEALAEQYQKALEAAQSCDPEIDRPQCTVQVQSSVPCGCPVWANVDNEEELAALEKLAQQAERCIVICPAVLCVEPGPGVCSSSGSGSDGHCENGNLVAK